MAYLLFAGDHYYPKGGAKDLHGRFESIEAAISGHNPTEYRYEGGWANVLCLESLMVVKMFDDGKWFNPGEYQDY